MHAETKILLCASHTSAKWDRAGVTSDPTTFCIAKMSPICDSEKLAKEKKKTGRNGNVAPAAAKSKK